MVEHIQNRESGRYQPYPEYKDSGIEWLGKIPSHWDLIRYKNILSIMQGMAFKSSDYVDKSTVINVRMGNVKKGGDIDFNHNIKYLPESYKMKYQPYELKNGDVIIAMTDMSPSLDFLAIPALLNDCDEKNTYLLNQRVGKLIINQNFDVRFIRYLLLSENLRTQLKLKGLGTVQSNMSSEDLYESYFCCPSKKERLQIAQFLDYETAKIDLLIEKQQKLIELLKEKRQAVISHAVTKGLDPNVEMKDSGVEWLGEVPAHWEVKPLFSLFNSDVIKNKDGKEDNVLSLSYGHIIQRDVSDNYGLLPQSFNTYQVVENGDIILRLTDLQNDKRSLRVGLVTQKGIITSAYLKIKANSKIHSKYSYLLLYSYDIAKIFYGMGTGLRQSLTFYEIKKLPIISPPFQEQTQIAEYLDTQTSKIDLLIEKAEAQITLMQERRAALISAAVTGKIDLRHWQMPEASNHQEGDYE